MPSSSNMTVHQRNTTFEVSYEPQIGCHQTTLATANWGDLRWRRVMSPQFMNHLGRAKVRVGEKSQVVRTLPLRGG